ncbi:universal stress protein [Halorussus marinus]|uniref:universal stress protein n=1 Tax=Halorussus marinus TaxID=2505976 RepID=UPI00106EED49|nr:universal stress protein [Halorussus marinus]
MTEPPLAVETVLVPVDGSDESVEAAEYAAAVAETYGASVHAMYVLGEEFVRGIETGTVAEEEVLSETEAFMETVGDLAEEYGVELSTSNAYGFSTTRKTQHPGSAILDTADDLDADFLVIPREPVSGEPGEVLEKAAEYVLLYASQPVLSV